MMAEQERGKRKVGRIELPGPSRLYRGAADDDKA